jgi:Mn-dependent DtxR family transcriptional regulator
MTAHASSLHASLLALLGANPATEHNCSTLAERFKVQRASISTAVTHLVNQGFVTKTRRGWYQVTEHGARAHGLRSGARAELVVMNDFFLDRALKEALMGVSVCEEFKDPAEANGLFKSASYMDDTILRPAFDAALAALVNGRLLAVTGADHYTLTTAGRQMVEQLTEHEYLEHERSKALPVITPTTSEVGHG